jgi:hypothetical protein
MPSLGMTKWDSGLGRELYDLYLSYTEIGDRVGTTGSAVSAFAVRHWPPRDEALVNRPAGGRPGQRKGRRPPGTAKKLHPGQPTLPPLASLEES